VRDLPLILESILEYSKVTKNADVLTEYVRISLKELIKKLFADNNGVIHCILLSPVIDDILTNSLQMNNQNALSTTLGLAPEQITNIRNSLTNAIEDITTAGYLPTVICATPVRPYFYRMIHKSHPAVSVISHTELPDDTEIEIHSRVDI
jgi:flagellar biosynthesis protein FlhA